MAAPDPVRLGDERLRLRDAERTLTAQLHQRELRLSAALGRLREIAALLPPAASDPDSDLTEANREHASALSAYDLALHRSVDFVLTRVVPADLDIWPARAVGS